jgi:putative protease
VAVVARAYRMAIDAWNRDPENWSAKPFLDELETVASRGFTTAFHNGRVSNYGHNYESTGQVAEWQFAGIIEEVHDDAFIMLAKNKLEAGDVLEFVPPNASDVIALRIYDFEDAKNGSMLEHVNPGLQTRIRIPFSAFDQIEDKSILKDNFTPMSVVRKEKALTEMEWSRLKLDKTAARMEAGEGRESAYAENQEKMKKAVDENLMDRRMKSPRIGRDGCCGRGCNGCMIFWQAPEYAKARELMKSKKQGEMLDRNMRNDMIDNDPLETAAE